MKKTLILTLLISVFGFCGNLDNILLKIKEESAKLREYNQQKEATFLKEKEKQQSILSDLKAKVAKIKEDNEKINQERKAQLEEISLLKKDLAQKSENIEELFGVAKQSANDLFAAAQNSLLRTQFPLDENFLHLAKSKSLPNSKELETLWTSYIQEIINSGKIGSFNTSVVLSDGTTTNDVEVTRVGPFVAFTNNGFLEFVDSSLIEYQKQPDRYLSYATDFKDSTGFTSIAIDPTKGSLFSVESLKPDIKDRLNQAGGVGYVIIAAGILGLIIGIFQLVRLFIIESKIKNQIKNINNLSKDNALGRVLLSLEGETKEKNLEILLNQSVLKESAKISTIKSLVKLLSAVAPMLGLLGTVVGMIATFQAITIFGTGEPQLMAGGISQALITTVLGLVVAIPLLFLYALLNAKSQSILQVIYEQSMGLLVRKEK